MNNAKIAALNTKRKELNAAYAKVAVEYTQFKDEYIEKLTGIGNEIHEVDKEIRLLKTPVEE